MKLVVNGFVVLSMLLSFSGYSYAGGAKEEGLFCPVREAAPLKEGVREISYEQLMDIKNSGEKYELFDVLSKESYKNGHIPGAKNFPVNTISAETAGKELSKDAHIVVYCGGFLCHASTEAAEKLSGLGYNVVDYKGGLEEWQAKGNELVK